MGTPDMKIYEFDLFTNQPGIVHGVFTRNGGGSKGPLDSLNVGLNCGDDPAVVTLNRKQIQKKMGLKSMVFLNQVHGAGIKVIQKDDDGTSRTNNQMNAADAVITDMKDLGLVIQVADCQAVLLVDPEIRVIANIHSGWRGSVNNIIGRCITVMAERFHCRPENVIAGISPSLGPCCSEFIHYKNEIPHQLWKYKAADRPFFDFWEISRDQLMDKGVKKTHIENMNICTKCRMDQFYSYRGEKNTGRFACVIAMR